MNFMLFHEDEWGKPLTLSDTRASHCRDILRLVPGDTIKVACLGKGTGIASIVSLDTNLVLSFPDELDPPEPGLSLRLILGHVRPLVMQRLFKDLASLGVSSIWVVNAGLTETSYFKSSFWAKNEYLQHLFEGAMQGGLAVIPEIKRFYSLGKALEALGETRTHQGQADVCLACHPGNYPPLAPVFNSVAANLTMNLAIGPERGWDAQELDNLLSEGFSVHSLGPRILRTELVASSLCVLRAMS